MDDNCRGSSAAHPATGIKIIAAHDASAGVSCSGDVLEPTPRYMRLAGDGSIADYISQKHDGYSCAPISSAQC